VGALPAERAHFFHPVHKLSALKQAAVGFARVAPRKSQIMEPVLAGNRNNTSSRSSAINSRWQMIVNNVAYVLANNVATRVTVIGRPIVSALRPPTLPWRTGAPQRSAMRSSPPGSGRPHRKKLDRESRPTRGDGQRRPRTAQPGC